MLNARLAWVMSYATVLAAVGCAAPSSNDATGPGESSSEDNFTAASMGLWTLDGTPQSGDIEVLQLGARNYASLTHQPATRAAGPMAAATPGAHPSTTSPAQPTIVEETYGDLWRSGPAAATLHATAASSLEAVSATPSYTASVSGDVLKLTSDSGRVLTYRRTYKLYCVPTDRSIEATALVHMGKSPSIIGINGDGQMFPEEGTYSASVRTDVLFQLRNYEIVSHTNDGRTIVMKFAWSDMNKSMIDGTMSIVGGPSGVPATPIQCERDHS